MATAGVNVMSAVLLPCSRRPLGDFRPKQLWRRRTLSLSISRTSGPSRCPHLALL